MTVTYDILVNQPVELDRWVVVTPSIGTSGEIVTSDVKVVQRVSSLLLTRVGSVLYSSTEGSLLYQLLGSNLNQSSTEQQIRATLDEVVRSIADDDNKLNAKYPKPDSEIVTNIELVNFNILENYLMISVRVIVASGENHEFKVPLPVPVSEDNG